MKSMGCNGVVEKWYDEDPGIRFNWGHRNCLDISVGNFFARATINRSLGSSQLLVLTPCCRSLFNEETKRCGGFLCSDDWKNEVGDVLGARLDLLVVEKIGLGSGEMAALSYLQTWFDVRMNYFMDNIHSLLFSVEAGKVVLELLLETRPKVVKNLILENER